MSWWVNLSVEGEPIKILKIFQRGLSGCVDMRVHCDMGELPCGCTTKYVHCHEGSLSNGCTNMWAHWHGYANNLFTSNTGTIILEHSHVVTTRIPGPCLIPDCDSWAHHTLHKSNQNHLRNYKFTYLNPVFHLKIPNQTINNNNVSNND